MSAGSPERPWPAPAAGPREEKGSAAPAPVPDTGLAARLSWTYPHQVDVELPSKLTATQLKGRELDREMAEDTAQGMRSRPEESVGQTLRRPRFVEEEFGLTSAQKGVALHLVMQYIDFDKTASAAQVAREIRRLVREEFLTPEQGDAVEPERIAAFFASPLGREVRAARGLRRSSNSPFWSRPGTRPEAGEEERVLLQGVVDCCFETSEGITVVDFKTDRVRGEALRRRAEGYRSQLETYSRALEEIMDRPVVRRVLWFFSEDRAVEL